MGVSQGATAASTALKPAAAGVARGAAVEKEKGGLRRRAGAQIILLDLKSPNVLLARDWTAKIADFGVAKILRTDFLTTLKDMGTFAWAAPEVLLGKPCTEKARRAAHRRPNPNPNPTCACSSAHVPACRPGVPSARERSAVLVCERSRRRSAVSVDRAYGCKCGQSSRRSPAPRRWTSTRSACCCGSCPRARRPRGARCGHCGTRRAPRRPLLPRAPLPASLTGMLRCLSQGSSYAGGGNVSDQCQEPLATRGGARSVSCGASPGLRQPLRNVRSDCL
jgi:hypothetical protein